MTPPRGNPGDPGNRGDRSKPPAPIGFPRFHFSAFHRAFCWARRFPRGLKGSDFPRGFRGLWRGASGSTFSSDFPRVPRDTDPTDPPILAVPRFFHRDRNGENRGSAKKPVSRGDSHLLREYRENKERWMKRCSRLRPRWNWSRVGSDEKIPCDLAEETDHDPRIAEH